MNPPPTPIDPDAEVMERAVRLHKSGKFPEAEALYRQVIGRNPDHPDALHLLGVLAHQGGNNEAAAGLISRAIALRSSDPAFHSNLGAALMAQGKTAEAAECQKRAIRLKPDYPEAYGNLGAALKEEGRLEEAQEALARALRLRPDFAEAHINMGLVRMARGEFEGAAGDFQHALRLLPGHVETHNNLGKSFYMLGRFADAAEAYRRSVELAPGAAVSHFNLGTALMAEGDHAGAISCFRSAIRLEPDNAQAHNNLGVSYKSQAMFQEAAECYQKAVGADPDYAEAFLNMGVVLEMLGRAGEARESYQRALRIAPEKDVLRLRIETLCPLLPDGQEEIALLRGQMDKALMEMEAASMNFDVSDLSRWGGAPSFFMVYHGENDRALRERYGRIVAGGLDRRKKGKRRRTASRPHAGIVVTSGHEGIFLKLTKGLLENISSDKVQATIVCSPAGHRYISARIGNGDIGYCIIPGSLPGAAEAMRAEGFDVLYYFEVGTDALNYYLPFFQPAPAQCTSWRYPVTTGIPEMTHFVSSRLMEGDGAQDHYSERLILKDSMLIYYYRPEISGKRKSRGDFGFSGSENIYLCPQGIYKFHPDFDEVLGGILRGDPRGRLVLVEGFSRGWKSLLMDRFRKTIPEVAGRISFVPRQSRDDFLNLMAASDVMLDPVHYSGGNTTLEALAVGTPVVTLPSAYLRGRTTLGCYGRMGMMECVASSRE